MTSLLTTPISSPDDQLNKEITHSWTSENILKTKLISDVQISPDDDSILYVVTEPKILKEKNVFSIDLKAIPLTSDQFCVRGCGDFGTINSEFDWSIDSEEIIFSYSPTAEYDDFYLDSSLASINIKTNEVFHYEKHAPFEACPRYSPDGKTIAYLCGNSSQQYTFNRQVATRSINQNNVTLLSDTLNGGPFISGPNLLGWSKDGSGIYFFEPLRTKNHLVLIPIDGTLPKEINTLGLYLEEPSLNHDQTMLGCIVQTADTPPEVFLINLNHSSSIQVSSLNEDLLSFPKFITETITWKSRDGLNIEGLLTYPLNYDAKLKYPLLTVVHGGLMAFFDETYLGTYSPYPLASFAEKGFFIFRPNPRGSTGYGKEFRCANYNDFGGEDFHDIVTGIDELIEKMSIDPERLGIMGWSYGGYMTAWAITQTNRFKAASVGAGLSNLISMYGTTDLYRLLPDYLGSPFENRQLYEERSPLTHLENITTPCLIQHGTHDKRVPVSQGYELYHAMESLKKDVSLVLYPEMGHRFTDPNMQIDVMERNIQFFKQHL